MECVILCFISLDFRIFCCDGYFCWVIRVEGWIVEVKFRVLFWLLGYIVLGLIYLVLFELVLGFWKIFLCWVWFFWRFINREILFLYFIVLIVFYESWLLFFIGIEMLIFGLLEVFFIFVCVYFFLCFYFWIFFCVG